VAVDHLDATEGEKITLERVLLLSDGEKVTIGAPTVAGAAVSATVAEHFKGEKIIVFNYKPKVRYDKKRGHRQQYTRLTIETITGPGIEVSAPVKEPAREEEK
jgi:large subunit ribosomal protein L21